MKNHKPIITDSGITYFPCYEVGVVGTGICLFMASLYVALVIWNLFDNSISDTTRKESVISFSIITILLLTLTVFLKINAPLKISLTNTGIDYVNHRTKTDKHISWSEVSAVYFHQSSWNGRRSCKICLKSSSSKLQKQDFNLPLYSIEAIDFWNYIPKDLWKNQPKNVFF